MLRHYATYGSAAMVVMCLLVGHPVQAQTATPDACATDGAARWATVLAYESPTPTATPTAAMYLACDINTIIAAGDTLTVPYTIYHEYYAPGAHSVALAVYVDYEQVALVNTGLSQPDGSDESERAITWQDKWNGGRHNVLLVVESTSFAPIEAECEDWFGTEDFAPALSCMIETAVNYSTAQLSLDYTTYYTTDLETHHVNGYVYIDNVLAHDALFNLTAPGVSTGTFTLDLQPRHLAGQHTVRYVLQSQEHAPLAAECEAFFGDEIDNVEVYSSDGKLWVYRREVTSGEDRIGAAIHWNFCPVVLFLVTGAALVVILGRRGYK